jgi:hypothetical protein
MVACLAIRKAAAITCRRGVRYLNRRFIKAGKVGGIAATWLSGRLEQSA